LLDRAPAIGQCAGVPDSVDYEKFFGMLEYPERWTEADRRMVEFRLTEQRQLLAACHPKDQRRRRSLTAIVEQIEAALSADA
jgi:hypothetical protein